MSLAELQSGFIASLRTPSAAAPESLAAPAGMRPNRRFNVYRNNVVVSLIEALRSSFPVVERLVGEEFFKATARAYIDHEPPRSPLMFQYGETFGSFLDAFPPAASVPYLGDVARLEFARLTAYHAQDRAAIALTHLSTLPPEQLGGAEFQLHPSLTLLTSRWPVFSLWAASSEQQSAQDVNLDTGEDVIVIRPEYDVDVRCLPSGGYGFLRALQGGASLGEAAEQATQTTENFNLAHHLEGLFGLGAVCAVELRNSKQ
nr:DNA-binding domain-containing protein [Denitrobaculum tricleocarpae]